MSIRGGFPGNLPKSAQFHRGNPQHPPSHGTLPAHPLDSTRDSRIPIPNAPQNRTYHRSKPHPQCPYKDPETDDSATLKCQIIENSTQNQQNPRDKKMELSSDMDPAVSIYHPSGQQKSWHLHDAVLHCARLRGIISRHSRPNPGFPGGRCHNVAMLFIMIFCEKFCVPHL